MRLFWAFYALVYDAIWDSAVSERIADAVSRALPKSGRVADFGAGTGLIARTLSSRGFHVVVIDPSKAMLRQARLARRATEFLNAQTIPEGRRFDAVIAVNVLHLVSAPELVLEHLLNATIGLVVAVWPQDEVNLRDLAQWERDGGKSRLWVLRAGFLRILVGVPGMLFRVRTMTETKLRSIATECAATHGRIVEFVSISQTGCTAATFTFSSSTGDNRA